MGSFQLVVGIPEELPLGNASISMCIDAEAGDLNRIQAVVYAIGDKRKRVEEYIEERFLVDMEVPEWKGKAVVSELLLKNGERWRCSAMLRNALITEAFELTSNGAVLTEQPQVDPYVARLPDLERQISEGLQLLQQCEEVLQVTRDPLEIKKYEKDIERIRALLEEWREEYKSLSATLAKTQPARINDAGTRLDEISSKLDRLSGEITSVRDNMRQLREEILAQFEVTRRALVAPILEQVPDKELPYVQAAVAQKGAVPPDESEEIIGLVREVLHELRGRATALPDLPASQIESLSDAIDDPKLALEHRFELSIPIIPFILNYKGVAKLTSGTNLNTAWQWVKSKFHKGRES